MAREDPEWRQRALTGGLQKLERPPSMAVRRSRVDIDPASSSSPTSSSKLQPVAEVRIWGLPFQRLRMWEVPGCDPPLSLQEFVPLKATSVAPKNTA